MRLQATHRTTPLSFAIEPFAGVSIFFALLLGLTACNSDSKTATTSTHEAAIQLESIDNNQSAVESLPIDSTPPPTKEVVSTITDTSAIEAEDCIDNYHISETMSKIGSTNTIDDIHIIQQQLKTCLPTADNATVLTWLEEYQAMYNRFLSTPDNVLYDSRHYNEVMTQLENGQQVPRETLRLLNPRVQYLAGLVQNDSNVSVLYLGEGFYTFTHDLNAMADMFTPYLHPDQVMFVERMAKDNQVIFWNDAAVNVSYKEVADRAVFWENYIKKYPNGFAIDDAKTLFNTYRYVLFFGSDNTQWLDDDYRKFLTYRYNEHNKIDPDNDIEQILHQLANRPNSVLANDAKHLLQFVALSDEKRMQKYPVPKKDKNGYVIEDYRVAHYQIEQAMQIPSIWDSAPKDPYGYRDCSSGVVCFDVTYN